MYVYEHVITDMQQLLTVSDKLGGGIGNVVLSLLIMFVITKGCDLQYFEVIRGVIHLYKSNA